MKRTSVLLPILLLILISNACLIKPAPAVPDPWTEVEGYLSNTNIRILHTTPQELYILSDGEFARMDQNNQLVEKRALELPSRFYGRPAVSDDTFYQLIRNDSDSLQVNFYLTKNQDPIYSIQLDDFLQAGDTRFRGEDGAKNTGTYSDDGKYFVMPVIQNPSDFYTFLLFEINLDPTKTQFESVEMKHRIDLVDFPADASNLSNVKFIDGYFYATSLDGMIRINPANGNYTMPTAEWVRDVFKYEDKFYASGGFSNILFQSEDNGQSFQQVEVSDQPPAIEMVEIINNNLLSQSNVGFPFNIVDPQLESSKRLLINSDFTENFSAYQDIEYFNGKYYLPVFKQLFISDELVGETE